MLELVSKTNYIDKITEFRCAGFLRALKEQNKKKKIELDMEDVIETIYANEIFDEFVNYMSKECPICLENKTMNKVNIYFKNSKSTYMYK